MAKVTMPQLGESVAEGTIGKWLKQPGDSVAKYEPLLEVITDKVNAEVPSPVAGILREILVQEGETVPNNAEIAVIEEVSTEAGADTPIAPTALEKEAASSEPDAGGAHVEPSTAQPSAGPAASAAAARGGAAPVPSAPTGGPEAGAPGTVASAPVAAVGAAAPAPAGDADARMTPAVRRLLREHGLSPALIVGSGSGGRITREDVLDYVESARTKQPVGRQSAVQAPPPAAAPVAVAAPAPGRPLSSGAAAASRVAAAGPAIAFPPGADEVLVPMTQMRKGIAAQMTRALAVPHAYVSVEVDATNLVRLREVANREYREREGISLSFVPFVVKACVEALRRNPTVNAHWTEGGLLAKRRINVGVAVAVDEGLIVPVVRDVDQLSVNGINRAIADVAARARAGKLRVDDFGGGTFTVDNTGWLGSNLTMPIINVPEVAILTMEQIRKRAVVVETPDGDVIAIRPVMNMVLGIDHRANDGAGGAAFLRDVKAWLEAVGPETAVY